MRFETMKTFERICDTIIAASLVAAVGMFLYGAYDFQKLAAKVTVLDELRNWEFYAGESGPYAGTYRMSWVKIEKVSDQDDLLDASEQISKDQTRANVRALALEPSEDGMYYLYAGDNVLRAHCKILTWRDFQTWFFATFLESVFLLLLFDLSATGPKAKVDGYDSWKEEKMLQEKMLQ